MNDCTYAATEGDSCDIDMDGVEGNEVDKGDKEASLSAQMDSDGCFCPVSDNGDKEGAEVEEEDGEVTASDAA